MRTKINVFASLVVLMSVVLTSVSFAFPDEGMYTPDQIVRLPLLRRGLKIKPTDIYNPNGVSLADAIVRVNMSDAGGFGTGEFVSPDGLILTNHHVGFDALVHASTKEKDYATNGYKANSRADELPAKDYNLILTQRVEDVTAKIWAGAKDLTGDARAQAIKKNITDLENAEKAKAPKGATIRIQSVNDGYFYYLYQTMSIQDVRVVYAPPKNIGFFGGDPDNFEWSRHTGDFTFLRAYVAPDGSTAEYSPSNVPFKPKKFLTVSLNGVRENDFVFVLGYPGGTTRYRESQSVAFSQNTNFPFIVDYVRAWSDALKKVGEDDEDKRIKLQGEIFSLNNTVKAFEGGVASMRRADIINKRKADEAKFAAWVAANPSRQAKYGELLPKFNNLYTTYYATSARDRVLRTFPNTAIMPVFKQIFDAVNAVSKGIALTDEKRGEITSAFQNREPILEREMIKYFLRAIAELPANQKFAPVENAFNRYQGKQRRAAEETFAEMIAEKEDFNTPQKIFALYDMKFEDLNKKYPHVVEIMSGLAAEQAQIAARLSRFAQEANLLRYQYVEGMSEMRGAKPYPDANASLRFTYGNVRGYKPREAVTYAAFTTLKGVIEKDTGEEPFDVPQRLKELQRNRDFGRYGVGDSVPVNFLATTDIIGGNSGSPVLNGNGEQVGIVFDGNYEGLGNDIFFDPDYGRTIAVDIRYVLFVTEKLGGAGWILNEMNIKGGGRAATTAAR
ncbi:MAG TPA: S46 family peptidase [Pyrinomonadaceae bacterium]